MENSPVEVTVSDFAVEITPEILAKAFWGMDTQQQADFFESLANHIEASSPHAYGFGEMQWCFLQDELRRPGREQANKMHMALSAFAFDFWPQKLDGARTGL
ncbi:hypothetical protein [Pseudomonas vancouverensis]|uniref:Uncharacterized protein n=1 Tax=Pseudomonas vancouverensis TaxID=95300 RepID=A0A1H2MUD5_PSEVA|nr:hypothetical protein [Pseudomonas vancouverensis]KAB0489723.1 hypothetical protein F7R09_28825 [Pseudomonas vancouverensis]TDB67219.1 hypothetical protein EIY72_03995 [Pseudomonas vancouverensis]SDU96692.1 hypothetical protein SAMN05216558_1271 [Pseudomonas vancouverensis]